MKTGLSFLRIAFVFLCDGQSAGQIPPHALFRLNRSGGQVYLVRSGEIPRILDAIFYGPLPADAAFGIPEGGGDPRILERPTPGTPNSAATGLFVRGDPNDDGQRDLSDAIFILSFLYLGGPAPPEPFTECGVDTTPASLKCEAGLVLAGN